MTDAVETPVGDASAETLEETPLTTLELSAQSYADGSKVTDAKGIDKAVEGFVKGFGKLIDAKRTMDAAKRELADLLMVIRRSVALSNGKPDFRGNSKAYKAIFQDRVKDMIRAEWGITGEEASDLLNTVRVNYVNRYEMVWEDVIAHAVRTGEVAKARGVKAAEVKDDGTVVITRDNGNEVTYVPGQVADVPTVIRNVAAKAADELEMNLPERLGGAERPRGGRTPVAPANPLEAVNAALAMFTKAITPEEDGNPIQPLRVTESLHAWLGEYLITLIGEEDGATPGEFAGGKDKVAEQLAAIATTVKAAGAFLADKGTKAQFYATLPKVEEDEQS
jgi:hypothetical protein